MLLIFLKGIFIGLFVSAPMGPIGMLCVQRTLNRGRWHGFITGAGAAFSDALYALVILLGMGIISDFLEKNEAVTLVVGSIILFFFGLMVFLSHPMKNWTPDMKQEETRYKRDFWTAFLLTLSNAAIIFVFIMLFARFDFNPLEQGGWISLSVGILAIILGALLWWFLLTTILSKTRRYFSRSGLILLNKVVGSILMLFGIVGILSECF